VLKDALQRVLQKKESVTENSRPISIWSIAAVRVAMCVAVCAAVCVAVSVEVG